MCHFLQNFLRFPNFVKSVNFVNKSSLLICSALWPTFANRPFSRNGAGRGRTGNWGKRLFTKRNEGINFRIFVTEDSWKSKILRSESEKTSGSLKFAETRESILLYQRTHAFARSTFARTHCQRRWKRQEDSSEKRCCFNCFSMVWWKTISEYFSKQRKA